MNGFRHKQPDNYADPYVSMLDDIERDLNAYFAHRRCYAEYVIINTEDREHVIKQMKAMGMMPKDYVPGKLQFKGIKIITSPDIPQGFFSVTGA